MTQAPTAPQEPRGDTQQNRARLFTLGLTGGPELTGARVSYCTFPEQLLAAQGPRVAMETRHTHTHSTWRASLQKVLIQKVEVRT